MWVNEIVLLQLGRETIDAYQNEYYSMLQEILIIPLKMNSLQICKDKLVKNIVYCCITLHCFVYIMNFVSHSVVITEIYYHTFSAKIS